MAVQCMVRLAVIAQYSIIIWPAHCNLFTKLFTPSRWSCKSISDKGHACMPGWRQQSCCSCWCLPADVVMLIRQVPSHVGQDVAQGRLGHQGDSVVGFPGCAEWVHAEMGEGTRVHTSCRGTQQGSTGCESASPTATLLLGQPYGRASFSHPPADLPQAALPAPSAICPPTCPGHHANEKLQLPTPTDSFKPAHVGHLHMHACLPSVAVRPPGVVVGVRGSRIRGSSSEQPATVLPTEAIAHQPVP